jgi:hypothetical protein
MHILSVELSWLLLGHVACWMIQKNVCRHIRYFWTSWILCAVVPDSSFLGTEVAVADSCSPVEISSFVFRPGEYFTLPHPTFLSTYKIDLHLQFLVNPYKITLKYFGDKSTLKSGSTTKLLCRGCRNPMCQDVVSKFCIWRCVKHSFIIFSTVCYMLWSNFDHLQALI